VNDFSFEAWVRDLETVTNSLGLERFTLLGVGQAGAVSIAYTVRHPERVSKLILYGAYAKGWNRRNMSSEELQEMEARRTLMRRGWGQDNPSARMFAAAWMPDASLESVQRFSELQRVSTSPENALRFLNEFGNIDVYDLLPKVSVPTIIFHSRDDVASPFEQGRELARLIPDSRFVPLEGKDFTLPEGGAAWNKFLLEVRNFLDVKQVPSEPPVRTKETGLKSWLRGPKAT
jgi:pimeloyl-ACP methyl ester carboxylesterase